MVPLGSVAYRVSEWMLSVSDARKIDRNHNLHFNWYNILVVYIPNVDNTTSKSLLLPVRNA